VRRVTSATTGTPDFPPLDGVRHRYVDLPGLRMHVAEAGPPDPVGGPVLLLHGFPQHWWGWNKVIPGLAEHYRVICPDFRGAGWTDAPRNGYTAGQLVADVVALLDTLELDRVRLIGHDWGALVGFLLCLQHPDRVERYVSLAIPHPYVRFAPPFLAMLPRLWFQYAIATPVLGPRLLSKGRQPLARYLLANYTSDPGVWSAQDIELFVAPFPGTGPRPCGLGPVPGLHRADLRACAGWPVPGFAAENPDPRAVRFRGSEHAR
jgi:pimeloyl-ACP methyl ester carboxylesterase